MLSHASSTFSQSVGSPHLPVDADRPSHSCWLQEELPARALQPVFPRIREFSLKKATNTTEESPLTSDTSTPGNSLAVCQDEGYSRYPNPQNDVEQVIKLVASLKACADQGDLHTGSRLHDDICRRGLLGKNVVIGNALINMYAKCGALRKAREVFDTLPSRDVVSWNALLTGYAQNGHGREALDCFEQMEQSGFTPTAISIVCALKACGSLGALDVGQQVQARIVREGLLEINIVIANALIDMYVKCGCLHQAHEIFNELGALNAVSWNTLITGYVENEYVEEALSCFDHMQTKGFPPNHVTFVGILKACGSQRDACKGQEIHDEIAREGISKDSLVIGTALVDMYAKCGMLMEAQDIFDELEVLDVVAWTTLIMGYAQHGHGHQALRCFEQMQLEGLSPNAVTYAGLLKACSFIGDLAKGQDIHAQILKEGFLDRDFVAASALVDIYAKGGLLERAQAVFNEAHVQDVVLWNALIGGYAQDGHCEKALDCLDMMLSRGFDPDATTYACVLKACGGLGAACKGQELHSKVAIDDLRIEGTVLGTAFVDMYANCGMLSEAQQMFDGLQNRDVIAWNALLVGYAQLGEAEIAVNLLTEMAREGKEPSHVTFVVVLNACSHRGLLSMGQRYFEILIKEFCINPSLEHFSCMIDLFGRAGQLDLVIALIERLPVSMNPTMWHTFLNACIKWEHLRLGCWAFQQALELNRSDSASYVCMNNTWVIASVKEDIQRSELSQ